MKTSFWIVIFISSTGFSYWTSATPTSLQNNNKEALRLLSKRNVYFQTVEELLSKVSILQLRVQHIQNELRELQKSTSVTKECPINGESQISDCNENVVKELETAIQNLREELGQESIKSGEIAEGLESLREEMEQGTFQSSVKIGNVEETCQENSLKITENIYDIENLNLTINEKANKLSKEFEDIKNCMKATCATKGKRSIRAPSYISPWFHMKAYDAHLSKVIIEHGLNELPAKVDVQVRSTSGADNDWIFTGASVQEADDDTGEEYGGVAYFYNETHVILSVPTKGNNDNRHGYVVTTGHRNEHFIGNHHYKYTEGLVRARIWLLNAFPKPSYLSQWYSLDITDAEKSFHAIRHGLSSYPAFVTVQVRSINMTSEAAGSSLLFTNRYANGGGVVFGFDDRMVRIWTAYIKNTSYNGYGRLLGTGDGWAYGPGQAFQGEFKVTVWDSESFDYARFHVRESNVMEAQTGALSMPEIDIDNDLVSFYVQALDGPNEGFLFKGWGSSQAVLMPFGGAIYVHNRQGKFQTWRPNPNKQGYLININSPYGNGKNTQTSNSASFVAKLLKAVK